MLCCTNENIVYYLNELLLFMLYKVVCNTYTVDDILKQKLLSSCATVHYAVQGGFNF